VSKAFSMFKSTETANKLLLKFRVPYAPASCVEVSYCDLLESQTDLTVVFSSIVANKAST
jgi:hypothetical protein